MEGRCEHPRKYVAKIYRSSGNEVEYYWTCPDCCPELDFLEDYCEPDEDLPPDEEIPVWQPTTLGNIGGQDEPFSHNL